MFTVVFKGSRFRYMRCLVSSNFSVVVEYIFFKMKYRHVRVQQFCLAQSTSLISPIILDGRIKDIRCRDHADKLIDESGLEFSAVNVVNALSHLSKIGLGVKLDGSRLKKLADRLDKSGFDYLESQDIANVLMSLGIYAEADSGVLGLLEVLEKMVFSSLQFRYYLSLHLTDNFPCFI